MEAPAGGQSFYALGHSEQELQRLSFRRRICGLDVLCACGGDPHVIDASHAATRSQICRIELTSAQMQFLFDFLHKLLRRSAQLNC